MKGIKCNKPTLVAGDKIHSFVTISSTGELNIQQDTNMLMTLRPLKFTTKGELNVFWEIEDIEYKPDGGCYNENNDKETVLLGNGGPSVSLPIVLHKDHNEKWLDEVIDINIGLTVNGDKIILGKASFSISRDCIGHRKLCLPVRKLKVSKTSVPVKQRVSFGKKKNDNESALVKGFSRKCSSTIDSKLFILSKSASLDLGIDILDTLPHLYHPDSAINEQDIIHAQSDYTESIVQYKKCENENDLVKENILTIMCSSLCS